MDADIKIRDYQIADLAFYMAMKKSMNLSEPGTGKTVSVVLYQWFLWSDQSIGTAWVMPKRLLHKNRREILRFTHFKEEDVVILDGTPKQIERQLASGAKVFLMGFRRWTLSWKLLPAYIKAMMSDESHKGFKSAKSAATLAMFEAFDSKRFEWMVAMTGTLISGKLSSAYPVIRVIEPRYYSSEDAFLYQHAIFDWEDKIIGWKGHEKLAAIFSTHGIRRLFSDIFGDQEIVMQPEVTYMEPEQRRLYDEFHEKAIVDLDKFFLDGSEPGVSFIRARQLMEHPNRFPDLTNPGQFMDVIPGRKAGKEELLDFHLDDHQDSGKPLIIYTAMIPQQISICAELDRRGIKYGRIYGGLSLAQSDKIATDFEEGRIQMMVCSPACADVGFNWQFCGEQEVDHIIFMTTDYLDTTVTQAIRRAIRGKRSTPLRVTFFEYENSIDQKIFAIIHAKSVEANKVDPSRPILQLSGYERNYQEAA